MEQPRLARPKGCYAVRNIRSIGEQSGRTTGRLGSTGLLQAMPSEGRHSWHSRAHPPPLLSPGRVTLREDYGPGVNAAAAGEFKHVGFLHAEPFRNLSATHGFSSSIFFMLPQLVQTVLRNLSLYILSLALTIFPVFF